MKAILEFNLPEDQHEYDQANSASDMASFIWEFQGYLRGLVKYTEKSVDQHEIYDKWFEYKNDENINLDKLIQ